MCSPVRGIAERAYPDMSCDVALQMASHQRGCICNRHQGIARCCVGALLSFCFLTATLKFPWCCSVRCGMSRSQSSDSLTQAALVPLSSNGLLAIPILCFMWLMLISKTSVISPTILSAQCSALRPGIFRSRCSVDDAHQCCRDTKLA